MAEMGQGQLGWMFSEFVSFMAWNGLRPAYLFALLANHGVCLLFCG